MKWIKWILGIIVAGVLTLWPANLIMHHTGSFDMNNLTPFQYWIKFLTVPSLAFGLFLFLSAVFVPFQKKYAAITVLLLSLIFIGLGAYQHYIDNGVLQEQYIVRYSGFVLCLVIAFMLSYQIYKRSKWTS
jgi:uncharacterized paraquat-inducible protein A